MSAQKESEKMKENVLKGLWIPYEILTNENLSDKEKIIYSIILFFSKKDGYCTITNKYVATIICLSDTRVSKLISSLSKKKYIQVITNFQDTTKQIISRKIIPLVKYDNIVCLKTTTYIDNYNNKYCSNDNNSVVNNAKYKNNKYIKYTNSNYNDEFLNRLYANRKYGNNC